MESAWEAMASRNAEAQLSRSRAAASASLAAHHSFNKTANATTTGFVPTITSPPGSASSTSYSVAPKCNASLQNSYHRMVTDIEEYTLTNGAIKTAVLDDHESYTTFTLTGPTTYTTVYTRALRPGRPWQAYYPDNYQCCMDCYVYFPQVEVYYWPVPNSEETCANGSRPLVTAQAVLPSNGTNTAAARFNTLSSNSSQTGPATTVNAEGFTFVSPSVYVAFGDVSAGDACGAVGQKHTSVTLGFAPGVLQTVTALGKDHYDTTLRTRAFDPKNVLCPPDFEPETLFVQQDSIAGIHTYRPRIQIPADLQNLDPKWSTCVVDDYEGIDPPRQLVPASGFGDDPVATTSESPVQQATPAGVVPPLPKDTGKGGEGTPGKPPTKPPPDPPESNPNPNPAPQPGQSDPPPAQGLTESGPPPVSGGENTGSSGNSNPQQQPNPNAPSIQNPTNPNGNANNQPAIASQHGNGPEPDQPAVVVKGHTIQQGAPTVTIGGKPVVYSKGSVYVNGVAAPAPTIGNVPAPAASPKQLAKPVTLGGFKFTPTLHPETESTAVDPVVIVKGQTLTENGAPATINGKPVIYSGGAVYAAGTRVSVPTVQPHQPPSPVNVAGLSFTPQPILSHGSGPVPAVIVAGHTLTEGEPAVSVNGAKVAYSSGSVYVNGKAAALPTPAPQPADQVNPPVVVGGLSFYAAPSAHNQYGGPTPVATVAGHAIVQQPNGVVAIDGTTLSPGRSPMTISGTPISLNPTAIVIGSSTIPLPPTPTAQAIATAGAQIISQDAAGAVIVAGQTLVPSGAAVTISGTRYSLASTALIAGTSTIPLPTPAKVSVLRDSAGELLTVASNGGLVIRPGATISAGGPAITISGTPFSLMISGGSTLLLEGTKALSLSSSITPPPLEIFSSVVTADADGDYVVNGKTITPDGPAVTISGTRISIGHIGSAEILVVGTSTSTVGADGSISTGSGNQTSSASGVVSTTAVEPVGSAGAGGGVTAAPTSGSDVRSRISWLMLWGGLGMIWSMVPGII
ncbi:MAG: hypothetical protein Q9170_006069 [Blastenia crenularia]